MRRTNRACRRAARMAGSGLWGRTARAARWGRDALFTSLLLADFWGQRVGLDHGKLMRSCTYIDMLGRQFTRFIEASESCPRTLAVPPYHGAL